MKVVFIIIFVFSYSFNVLACSCDIPKPAIEFYTSDYVFEGEVISKIYAKDSLTYTVKFKVSKHYKFGDEPEFISYTFPAEGEFTGHFTSCDWSVDFGERWLVYSDLYNGKQSFSFYCSNSKPINEHYGIRKSEQIVLDNGNKLELENYRFINHEAKPVTDVDSILSVYNSKDLNLESKTFAPFWIDVDKEGNLTSVNLSPRENREMEVVDSIYGLNIRKNQYSKPRNEFESVALEIAKKVKKWDTYVFHGKQVRYRTFLTFILDENSKIVLYN